MVQYVMVALLLLFMSHVILLRHWLMIIGKRLWIMKLVLS
jgi:hypothetical protein